MKGSLVQARPARNGRPPYWELRVYGGKDPVTGKPRRTVKGHLGTRKSADAALRRLVTDVEAGRYRGTETPFAELLSRWYDYAEPDWSPKHRERVRGIIDRQLLPTLGAIPLDRLGPEHLDELYTRLRRQGLATGTIRKVHNTASRALAQGLRWGWISANPAARAAPPPVVSPEIVPPSDAQVARLCEVAGATNPDLLTFLAVAVATGARRGEVCALRRSSVELGDAPSLLIDHSVTEGGGDWSVKRPKTASSHRRISLDAGTAEALDAHLTRIAARAAEAHVVLDPNPYLFSPEPECSRPWRPNNVTLAFARLRTLAGVEGVRLHDLRHYNASILLSLGVDVRTVAGRVGHSNANITLKTYGHFMPAADRQAADLWDQRNNNGGEPSNGDPDRPDDPYR